MYQEWFMCNQAFESILQYYHGTVDKIKYFVRDYK